MNLTKTQIEQANALIEKYKFCSLETQKELQEAGFFNTTQANFSLCFDKNNETVELWGNSTEMVVLGRFALIPMPQMGEVWEVLPDCIEVNGVGFNKAIIGYSCHYYNEEKRISKYYTFGSKETFADTSCQLWLKLYKENLLCSHTTN